MARPAHQLVTLSGYFGAVNAPVEQWSFGLRFLDNRWDTTDAALPLAVKTAWLTNLAPLHGSSVHLSKVRAASVDALGHVKRLPSGAYNQVDWNGEAVGSGAQTQPFPPQVAVCVSLVSPRADSSGKGRVFLPFTIHQLVVGELRITSANAQAIADAFKAFHTAVAGYNPAGTSFTGAPGTHVVSSKGYASPVSTFRVGRSLDTMRSRRADLLEGYVTAAA